MADINTFAQQIRENCERVAELGNWPDYIPPESMLNRVPTNGPVKGGLDAGLACALDIIPRDRQYLAAGLHAAYTPELVMQVRIELEQMEPDSETIYWLAACSVCIEEAEVDAEAFMQQVQELKAKLKDPMMRLAAARMTWMKMKDSYGMVDGIPHSCQDGAAQAAYIAGHDLAVVYSPAYGIFFISTYLESLGLETFPWSDRKDGQGRPMSGPVHGSRQYVKASSFTELAKAVAIARKHLGV